MNPLGQTATGVTAWAMPGRTADQRTGVQHLTWGGPGDAIHLHVGGLAEDRTEYPGRDTGTVSGPCHTEAEAQAAVDTYLAGLEQEPAAGDSPWLARAGFPGSRQLRSAIQAAGDPAVTQGADETARILAEHGTPEQRLEYALMEAGRHKREAYTAARFQRDADGNTPAAKERYSAAYEAAHAGWTAEVASAVAEYARELSAAAPAATDDPAAPYNQGLSDGADMLMTTFAGRHSSYDADQWREYVAGFTQNATWHAEATSWYARAVVKQPQENSAGSPHETASSSNSGLGEPDGARPCDVSRLAAMDAIPGTCPGSAKRPEPGGPTIPHRQGAVTTRSGRQARPGRPR